MTARAGAAVPRPARGAARARDATRGSSRRGISHDQVAEIQRSRLIAAAASTVDDYGYEQASVSHITARARVSRRTFYELFANREVCIAALIEDVAARIEFEIDAADLHRLPWRERVRAGLWTILCFLEREPLLARVCVVQSQRGGSEVLALRDRIFTRLVGVLDEGRAQGKAAATPCTPLTAEALVGAAYGVIHGRIARRSLESLTELLGELMGMIAMHYMGPAAARREQAQALPPVPDHVGANKPKEPQAPDPLQGVRMRLTYRTVRVLDCIAEQPGINNRAVAAQAGVHDQGQISKLLARLQRLGLLANEGEGHAQGEPNAWRLTPLGERVTDSIGFHQQSDAQAAA
ncbi:MAG TPA: TetR/AcrR family transcriptional regulator [Solirubrobacteraceae bacterium]